MRRGVCLLLVLSLVGQSLSQTTTNTFGIGDTIRRVLTTYPWFAIAAAAPFIASNSLGPNPSGLMLSRPPFPPPPPFFRRPFPMMPFMRPPPPPIFIVRRGKEIGILGYNAVLCSSWENSHTNLKLVFCLANPSEKLLYVFIEFSSSPSEI